MEINLELISSSLLLGNRSFSGGRLSVSQHGWCALSRRLDDEETNGVLCFSLPSEIDHHHQHHWHPSQTTTGGDTDQSTRDLSLSLLVAVTRSFAGQWTDGKDRWRSSGCESDLSGGTNGWSRGGETQYPLVWVVWCDRILSISVDEWTDLSGERVEFLPSFLHPSLSLSSRNSNPPYDRCSSLCQLSQEGHLSKSVALTLDAIFFSVEISCLCVCVCK